VPIGVLCATLANNLAERAYTASASNSSIVALLQRIWQVQTEKGQNGIMNIAKAEGSILR